MQVFLRRPSGKDCFYYQLHQVAGAAREFGTTLSAQGGKIMLMANVILAVLLFAPLVITFLLKSNAALSFMALCVGFVLSTSVIGDLKHLLSEINLSATNSTLALVILIAPPVITLLLTRNRRYIKRSFGCNYSRRWASVAC
jgi:Na+-transporting methylmalonyl-CoA/oxaloacetate decarboxylase beta subunit